jgi:hypothetical protein
MQSIIMTIMELPFELHFFVRTILQDETICDASFEFSSLGSPPPGTTGTNYFVRLLTTVEGILWPSDSYHLPTVRTYY